MDSFEHGDVSRLGGAMHTVLVVDDQQLFRDIARSMFESAGDFEVVAEATDGIAAVEIYPELRPDLVLMDVQMARMNGFEATRSILSDHPDASVVIISMKADPEYRRLAQELGAIGFVAKRDLDAAVLRELLEQRQKLAA